MHAQLESLTILVIHHKTPGVLIECLEYLSRYAQNACISVIDTSPDEQLELVLAKQFEQVRYVPCGNHSMANAVNTGLKTVRTPFVAHMNADVFVNEHTFPALLNALQAPDVGMVGAIAVNRDGQLQQQGLFYNLNYWLLQRTPLKQLEVPWLSGCLQVLKSSVVKAVGGMNSSYRFYNEDMEWCYRLRVNHYRCVLVDTNVIHLGGSSTPQDARFIAEGYRGGMMLSKQYQSLFYQTLHRMVVLIEAQLKSTYAKQAHIKEAYSLIARMFTQQTYEESPFGAELQESNPLFYERLESL